MLGILAILIILLVCLVILYILKTRWSSRFYPPGPLRLPFIGSIWEFGVSFSKDTFIKLAKKYGNIYMFWDGSLKNVVLSGYEAVREGLIDHSEEFSDRPVTPFLKAVVKEQGIIFSNGHTWKQQRKFGLVTMRKLGLGKKGMEQQIEEEARQLAETFTLAKGQPFDPAVPITISVSNVICAVAFGHRFSVEDKEFLKLVGAVDCISKFTASIYNSLYDLFPWLLEHLPGPHRKALASGEVIHSFARKEVEKHKDGQALHEPQDFIDFYLWQIKKVLLDLDFVHYILDQDGSLCWSICSSRSEQESHSTLKTNNICGRSKNDPKSTYNEDNLTQCIFDLFIAGTETTSLTLRWALLLMANHPDVQERVHKEIEDVLGFSRSFSYQDLKKLAYTNAVIHEITRFRYILLFGIPRKARKDVIMHGFLIPKEAIIIADLHSVLLDPKQWEKPQEFHPNHFLDKDGRFVEREAFLPFGAGSRVCLGEQLARIELFIFFTTLMRAFTFRLPEGVKEISTEPVVGISMAPQLYKLRAVPRCREPYRSE